MVVMVQKEVAQSMVAGPGGMSILGISVQLYGKPTIVDYVPAESFYPQPKVNSAIVRIDVYPRPAVDVTDIAGFFDIVKAGFSTPRKQIRNSLAIGLDRPSEEVSDILKRAEIDPRRRPETLSLDEWARLHLRFTDRSKA
jgi:16S rRNA (adenine1518-N6/adenine1519-N6)-dimethyltransferase